MQTGLYVAVSSQIALEKRMNTLADNVANSSTVGFRATEVKFNQLLGDTRPTKVVLRVGRAGVSEHQQWRPEPDRQRSSISPSRAMPGSRSTRPPARH